MSSESHESNWHEEFFKLMLGLLDDDKADELRAFIATDSSAAKEFDEVRKAIDLMSRAVRIERNASADQIGEGVIDLRSFERASGLAFDAASGVFEDGVFRQSERRKKKQNNKREISSNVSVLRMNHIIAKNKRQYKDKGLIADQPNDSSRKLFESLFFQTIKTFFFSKKFNLWGGTRDFFQKLSLFKKFIFAIVLFGVIISISIVFQETRLRRFFNEDYYVRAVVPDVLVRGVPQSITVLTTNLVNEPYRTSVRFDVVDAFTNEFVLSHSEWSNAEGLVRYDLTKIDDFPDKVNLRVSIAGKNDYCFERDLRVVNPHNLTFGRLENCFLKKFPLLKKNVEKLSFASYIGEDLIGRKLEERYSIRSFEEKQESFEERSASAEEKPTPTCIFVSIYPELGRLITGFPNRVGVFCIDSQGNPVAVSFTLSSDDESVAFETDEQGYGTFSFTPMDGRQYFLSSDSSYETTLLENRGDFQFEEETIGASNQVEEDAFVDTELKDVDVKMFSGSRLSCFVDSNVYFRPLKPIFKEDEPIELELTSTSKESLIATIDKDGAIVSQRLIDVFDGKKKISIQTPPNAGGLLKVGVYKIVGTESLQKVGETYLYKNCDGEAPHFTVEWLTNDQVGKDDAAATDSLEEKSRLVVDIERRPPFFEKGRRKGFVAYDESPLKLDVCWGAEIGRLRSVATLDDVLSECPDPLREKILSTLFRYSNDASPVLIDNSRQVRNSSSSKLQEFREKEAKTAGSIAYFGLLGCAALVVWLVFLVVFDALSFWRSLGIASLACVIGFFLCLEQKTLDYSSVLTASLSSNDNSSLSTEKSWDFLESSKTNSFELAEPETCNIDKLLFTRKVGPGETVIDVDSLDVGTDSLSGYIFVRVTDDKKGSWTILAFPSSE